VAEDMEQQTIELVELRDEVRTLHTRVAPLESLLKQRDSALFERGERIEAMTTQMQALVAQTESLQAQLRQRGEKIATLERKFSDQPPPPAPASESADRRGDHLEQRLVAQIERNRELTKIVEERDRDLAAAAKSNELNGKSMMVLKQQLDDARQTEERLAAQVRELKSASQRAPEPGSATAERPAMTKPNGLFELPPEQADELQQIRGIGDGFERGLNKLGIYQFSQLAGLSSSEIVWIEAHLPTFHGRIERDDWPGQAAALMAASEHAEWSLRARSAPSLSPRVN
jgi:predicted flap endonuclease-1-like 5' DNA nuclease